MTFLLAAVLAVPVADPPPPAAVDTVLVIAHRGASGYLPEHTLEAFALAVGMGADVIEPDLVVTRDGALVARHENDISSTTDIAARPEFADRRRTQTVDGQAVTGWFTEDFDLAELRTLRATERLPALRPQSAAFDGQFLIATFEEILELAARMGEARGRPVGVYPETKHPSHFDALGLSFDEPLLRALGAAGHVSRDAPVWIQSFEVGNLRRLRARTDVRLVQLAYPGAHPPDADPADPDASYDALMSPEGLARVAAYADAVGVHTSFLLGTGGPTRLVADARSAGLDIHAWTVRAENAFLPEPLRSSEDPAALGDVAAIVRALAEAGVDGLFTDHPDLVLRALGR